MVIRFYVDNARGDITLVLEQLSPWIELCVLCTSAVSFPSKLWFATTATAAAAAAVATSSSHEYATDESCCIRTHTATNGCSRAVCLCVVSLVAWRRAVALMSLVCKTSLFFPIAVIAALLFALLLLLLKLRFVLGYSEKYDFSRNVRISVWIIFSTFHKFVEYVTRNW